MLSVPQEVAVAVAPLSMYDPLPALREIKAPIRAINSDLFPTNVEGNRQHVPGYQVAIMKGVGHYPMLAEQPGGLQRAPGGGPARGWPERRTAVRLRVY